MSAALQAVEKELHSVILSEESLFDLSIEKK